MRAGGGAADLGSTGGGRGGREPRADESAGFERILDGGELHEVDRLESAFLADDLAVDLVRDARVDGTIHRPGLESCFRVAREGNANAHEGETGVEVEVGEEGGELGRNSEAGGAEGGRDDGKGDARGGGGGEGGERVDVREGGGEALLLVRLGRGGGSGSGGGELGELGSFEGGDGAANDIERGAHISRLVGDLGGAELESLLGDEGERFPDDALLSKGIGASHVERVRVGEVSKTLRDDGLDLGGGVGGEVEMDGLRVVLGRLALALGTLEERAATEVERTGGKIERVGNADEGEGGGMLASEGEEVVEEVL